MRARQFFSCSLGLPVLMALIGLALRPRNGLVTMVLYSMPLYVPTALWTWRRIRRANSVEDLIVITLTAPLIFCCALTVGASIVARDYAFVFAVSTAYFSFIGSYAFVMLVWIAYGVFRKLNLVVRDVAA